MKRKTLKYVHPFCPRLWDFFSSNHLVPTKKKKKREESRNDFLLALPLSLGTQRQRQRHRQRHTGHQEEDKAQKTENKPSWLTRGLIHLR